MLFTIYLLLFATSLIFLWRRKQNRLYPPGLPVWPVVGSLPYIVPGHLHFTIHKWAEKYGQIIGGAFGNKRIVFITGADNVLAASRKEEFQGRPQDMTTLARSFYKGLGIFFSDGQHWSGTRRFAVKHLRAFGMTQTESFMSNEIKLLIDSITDGSVMEMSGLFALSGVNVIWAIIANKTYSVDDVKIKMFLKSNKSRFRRGRPTGGILNIYPFLRHFSQHFKNNLNYFQNSQRLIKETIDEHREILDQNHPIDLIDHYLIEMDRYEENGNKSPFSEEDLITICFDLFAAGAETTSSMIDFMMLYMILYPEVQAKVHKELDHVLGRSRQPTLEDKKRMPYIMAVMSEVMRINPLVPIAVPHRCTATTTFNNYLIEKDTMIIIDLSALEHDPKYWEQPEKFNLDRFLNSDGEFLKTTISHPFGVGHRSCAGESLAKNISFLFISTFFEKYTISHPEGEPLPSTYPLSGLTTAPQPFNALIKSRY